MRLLTLLTMPRFEVKQSAKLNLTSYSGLALIGQCCQAAQVGQRLDAKGAELRELTDELTLRLRERTQAPITAYQGYVCADLDTFVMDQPAGRRTPRSGGPERSEGFGAAEHNSETKIAHTKGFRFNDHGFRLSSKWGIVGLVKRDDAKL